MLEKNSGLSWCLAFVLVGFSVNGLAAEAKAEKDKKATTVIVVTSEKKSTGDIADTSETAASNNGSNGSTGTAATSDNKKTPQRPTQISSPKPHTDDIEQVMSLTESYPAYKKASLQDRQAMRMREIEAMRGKASPSVIGRMLVKEMARREKENYDAAMKKWNETHPDGKPHGPTDFKPDDMQTPFSNRITS